MTQPTSYTDLLGVLASAAVRDLLREPIGALEVALLESLTDEGPYPLKDDPTVADLLDYARGVAGKCRHAVSLAVALESLGRPTEGADLDDLDRRGPVTVRDLELATDTQCGTLRALKG
jgi:hypothetical protein